MSYHTRSQSTKNNNLINDNLSNDNLTNNNNNVKDNRRVCIKLFKNMLGMIGFLFFTIFYYANRAFVCVWKIGGIYIVWCSLHYVTSQLYVYYCTPYTLLGFITAPFMVATPQCTGLRWCITHGAQTIISMWLVLGTWFIQKLGGYSLNE